MAFTKQDGGVDLKVAANSTGVALAPAEIARLGSGCNIAESAGFQLYAYDVVESTNLIVKQAIANGAPTGFAAFAREQTGGYGRHGSKWSSPRGGAYMSVLLRPDVQIEKLPTLGLVCALAVHRALAALAFDLADGMAIKWPNDIVYMDAHASTSTHVDLAACTGDFKKLAGISFEFVDGAACVGIGINVERPAAALSHANTAVEAAVCAKVRNTPIYLSDFVGKVLDPLDVAASVLEEIAKLYSVWAVPEVTFANFVAEFNSLLAFAEYDVKVCLDDGSEVARGRLRGVDAQGCLMVGDAKVTSGSMSLV